MFHSRFLLSTKEQQQIVDAIAEGEKMTSGEIRVHIEKKCDDNPLERAIVVFDKLGMHQTKDRNGVLIYIASSSQKMAIFGDEAIFNILGQVYWDASLSILRQHFSNKQYAQGIIETIRDIAQKLTSHFPYDGSTDSNELSNEISYEELI